jgi:hypothetical protein
MTDTKYNGWANYATWRVNLEIFDGFDYTENGFHGLSKEDTSDIYDLGTYLKDYAEDLIFDARRDESNYAYDYARAFLADVNWFEIATHMVDEVTQ